MMAKNPHSALNELITDLRNDEKRLKAINTLKELESNDDALLGLKWFMEKHNYDVSKLEQFLSNSQGNPIPSIPETPVKKSFPWLKIAAAFLVIISFSYLAYYFGANTNYYQRNAFYESGLPVVLSSNNKKEMDDWMTEFKSENYERAKEMGEVLLKSKKDNDTIFYFLGRIYCELGDYSEGQKLFEKVSNSSSFYDKSYFLSALCLLETNRTVGFDRLESIMKNKVNPYSEEANKILLELK
jgi:tetratricopeptide (TPR) repeat protein